MWAESHPPRWFIFWSNKEFSWYCMEWIYIYPTALLCVICGSFSIINFSIFFCSAQVVTEETINDWSSSCFCSSRCSFDSHVASWNRHWNMYPSWVAGNFRFCFRFCWMTCVLYLLLKLSLLVRLMLRLHFLAYLAICYFLLVIIFPHQHQTYKLLNCIIPIFVNF